MNYYIFTLLCRRGRYDREVRKEYDRDRSDRRDRGSYDRREERVSDRAKDQRKEEKLRRSKERKEDSSGSSSEGEKGGRGGDGFWDTKWDAMQLEEKLEKGEKRGRYYLNTKKRFKVRYGKSQEN